jgi:hypothetical protein
LLLGFSSVQRFSTSYIFTSKLALVSVRMLLGKVLTPIIMGTLFLAVVLPAALVLRLLRKDTIRPRPAPSLESYWLPKASGLTPETLKDQF